MKLYHYDHCPYCVKARMIFGFKNVDFELQALLNDDEETPISLTGKKMLPILVEEGRPPLPESLDIVDYIDGLEKYGHPIVGASRKDAHLDQWLVDVRKYHYFLAMPRWIKAGLEDFATQGAVDYFVGKKTAMMGGSFADREKESAKFIAMAHSHFKELNRYDLAAKFLWGELSYDDFHLFATLRCLTVVKGVEFSPGMKSYTEFISEKSKVPLHWDLAQ